MRYIEQQRLDIVSSKSKLKNVIHANITGLDMHCFSTLSLFWFFFWGVSESEGAFGDGPVNFNLFCNFDLNYNYNFNSNFNNDLLHRERNILLQLKFLQIILQLLIQIQVEVEVEL